MAWATERFSWTASTSGDMMRPAVFSLYSRSSWTSSDFSSFMRSSTCSVCSAGSSSSDLSGVVRREPVEDARDLRRVQGPRELGKRRIVELGEHLARLVAGQQAEDRDLVGHREVAQDGRDVGRVRLLEDLGEALPTP